MSNEMQNTFQEDDALMKSRIIQKRFRNFWSSVNLVRVGMFADNEIVGVIVHNLRRFKQ